MAKRKPKGSFLSRTNSPQKTSRQKRAILPVIIRKTIIERITPIGWSLIALAVVSAIALTVTLINN